ncbi:MAG TPA: biopolymer transporter ExbD [Phycisphaerales bacterium]|nr:biopolymer transporter ExbD [Phycisphaerales bacterium]
MLIRNGAPGSELHIDFVPMVDVLFNLLIFFLLATSMAQAEREMSIALPHAASSGPISAAMREIIINVHSDGRIEVAGKVVTAEELDALVRTAALGNPDQKVSVRGDRTAPYANVAAVLDVCKGAGIQQPYLETIPLR